MEIEVVGTTDIGAAYPELDKIAEALWESFRGLEDNTVMSILLGGAHSKGLENRDSDYDILAYYLPTRENLIALHKNTFHMQPTGMTQIREHPAVYDFLGMELEVVLAPVRTIGQNGKELWTNIAKCNMKTIHDFIKDYPLGYMGRTDEYLELLSLLTGGEFSYSLRAVDGYFRGFMTSQLKAKKRRTDWDKRELKSHREHDIRPVVKAVMSGLYIGLSGLAFLEEGKVYRDFKPLYEKYVPELFGGTDEGLFIWDCYQLKKDYSQCREYEVDSWLAAARVHRQRIYETIVVAYNLAKEGSWMGEQTPSDRRNNLIALDAMLKRWLG